MDVAANLLTVLLLSIAIIVYIIVLTRKSKTSERCYNSSVQSDPDDLVVHRGQSMKTMTRCSVDLFAILNSSRMRADGSRLKLS